MAIARDANTGRGELRGRCARIGQRAAPQRMDGESSLGRRLVRAVQLRQSARFVERALSERRSDYQRADQFSGRAVEFHRRSRLREI